VGRQGPRPHDPAGAAAAGGSGHRVVDRRRFLLTSVAGAVAVPLVAEARQAEKVYRLGVRTLISVPAFEDVFRQSLKDRGYIVRTGCRDPIYTERQAILAGQGSQHLPP
jgi:hypothetical protein